MKTDLIITRFVTEPVIGTLSPVEPKTFFGSKMIEIEDNITIDNSNIQYSQVIDTINTNGIGYQYYSDIDHLEKEKLISLFDIKKNNHSIILSEKLSIDKETNTNWLISINWKDILREYIFCKVKESRLFKCIKNTDLMDQNINLYIYSYIDINVLNRYKFDSINLYIEYQPLDNNDINLLPKLRFNPEFKDTIKSDTNLIANANTIITDTKLNIQYKQIKSSKDYKFDYYFDINFTKI